MRVLAQGRVDVRVRRARRLHAGMVIAAPWDFSVSERRNGVSVPRARDTCNTQTGVEEGLHVRTPIPPLTRRQMV